MANVKSTDSGDSETGLEDLVRRVKRGDISAFETIISRFRNRIYVLIWHIVRNEEDASDITQETFIKAWKSIKYFKGDASFPAWLFRISTNLSIDDLRRRKVRSNVGWKYAAISIDPATCTVPSSPSTPPDTLQNKEIVDYVQSAIAELSPDHRIVILLKEVEELSCKEIAAIVGTSLGTVMSRIFMRARSYK